MNAQDIIEANQDRLANARADNLFGMPCVIGTDEITDQEVCIFYLGECHVDCTLAAVNAETAVIIYDQLTEATANATGLGHT